MSQHDTHFLTVRFEGPQVSAGRMRLADFLEVATEMTKAVERVGLVLLNAGESSRRGARPKDLREAISLDLVCFTHGSPAAVAMFERSQSQMVIADMDLGTQAYTHWLEGFAEVAKQGTAIPPGYDTGVLLKNRDIGRVFAKGVTHLSFTLNHRPKRVSFTYTQHAVQSIRARIAGPERMEHTVEGRLVMVDFKESGPKFRIDRPIGGSVNCVFEESFRDEVHDNILKHVRVTGTACKDAGHITSIHLADIEPIAAGDEGEPVEGRPLTTGLEFWEHHTVEELADAQGVIPVSDPTSLLGGWPGDTDDGFEDWLAASRNLEIIGEGD